MKYKKYYKYIKRNQITFENALQQLDLISDINDKLMFCKYITEFAASNNTGYFTSSKIENYLTNTAKQIKTNLDNISYQPNSFLHVMTEGYNFGGHTRVVERWIKNAPDSQIHSIIFTNGRGKDLPVLEKNVSDKNGNVYYLNKSLSLFEQAKELRKIGMNYEYVILHIHMYDIIPSLAFATEDFTRPVFLYNHASHLFWIGKSIADIVLDIEDNDDITKRRRNISNTFFLGVPSDNIKFEQTDKLKIRQKLNLPLDKKIIISTGSNFKYYPICNDDFINIVKKLLDKDTICYVIGINKKTKMWSQAQKATKGRIKTLECMDYNAGFMDYLRAADLCLDSYPLGGGTALVDAISVGTPVLSLRSVIPQLDYLICTQAYCHTKNEFIYKAKKILNDKDYSNAIFTQLHDSLIKYQSTDVWNERINNLLQSAPKKHSVKKLENEIDYKEIDDLCIVSDFKNIIENNQYKPKNITCLASDLCFYKKSQGINNILQVLTYKSSKNKVKILLLFNIPIIKIAAPPHKLYFHQL